MHACHTCGRYSRDGTLISCYKINYHTFADDHINTGIPPQPSLKTLRCLQPIPRLETITQIIISFLFHLSSPPPSLLHVVFTKIHICITVDAVRNSYHPELHTRRFRTSIQSCNIE